VPNNNPLGGAQWSDDQCAELASLLASGMVYRLIAEALNEKFGTAHTKNAIVGKVQRLNLTPPDKPKRPPYVRKPKKSTANKGHHLIVDRIVRANANSNAMRVIKTVEMAQYKLRCVEIEPRHLTLLDLEPGDCRYPYGDDAVTYCGHPKQDGSSYCTPHHVLCREKPRVPVYRMIVRAA
jgi:GcrA cell cycle regulator